VQVLLVIGVGSRFLARVGTVRAASVQLGYGRAWLSVKGRGRE
jgi:hypothetical protein